jgi:hypothetical protein
MKTFDVKWEISIEASNKREAAIKALTIMLDLKNPENIATVFEVEGKTIDLLNYKNKIVNENK